VFDQKPCEVNVTVDDRPGQRGPTDGCAGIHVRSVLDQKAHEVNVIVD
jgi:hypothetical protein